MNFKATPKVIYFIILFFLFVTATAQNTKQEKMEQLNFMVGEWIGISKIYENGNVSKEGSAFQKISYDLDKNILVVELNTEFLQLHTIIYYDEKDKTYYYYPFSKRGVSRYPAKLENGNLVVSSSETQRFTFSRTKDGGFREHGEQLKDGKWVTYFEDTFTDSK